MVSSPTAGDSTFSTIRWGGRHIPEQEDLSRSVSVTLARTAPHIAGCGSAILVHLGAVVAHRRRLHHLHHPLGGGDTSEQEDRPASRREPGPWAVEGQRCAHSPPQSSPPAAMTWPSPVPSSLMSSVPRNWTQAATSPPGDRVALRTAPSPKPLLTSLGADPPSWSTSGPSSPTAGDSTISTTRWGGRHIRAGGSSRVPARARSVGREGAAMRPQPSAVQSTGRDDTAVPSTQQPICDITPIGAGCRAFVPVARPTAGLWEQRRSRSPTGVRLRRVLDSHRIPSAARGAPEGACAMSAFAESQSMAAKLARAFPPPWAKDLR